MRKKSFLNLLFFIILLTPGCQKTKAEESTTELKDYNWSASGFTTDFSRMMIDPATIMSGGPPKDGIPAVDKPSYTTLTEAKTWLRGKEPVIVVRFGDSARIYPIQILTWHEIVNDTLAGIPITVTFCPLCNTGVVFHRKFSGVVFDFGTTGRLSRSNLIMYDRQTESWWQQATGAGIIGKHAGDQLEFLPSLTLSFDEAIEVFPKADVLSRNTGHSRPYGQNPYAGYDSPGNTPFLYQGPLDEKYDAMERVLLLKHQGLEKIVVYSEVQEKGFMALDMGGRPIIVFWAPDAASALDRRQISEGRQVGSLNAFSAILEDETLQFSKIAPGTYKDESTGSLWNASGVSTEGSLKGRALEPIIGVQHFWFSAQAFSSSFPQ